MTEGDVTLVKLLAATDAVFVPCREFTGAANSNLYVARQDYPKLGVMWNSGGTGAAAWQAAHRTLAGLLSKALVTLHRPHVKTVRARLTDKGEDRARALCGLPAIDAGWASLLEVERRTKRPPKLMTDVWIDERHLAGEVPEHFSEGRWLALIEELKLPALNRGWLEARATGQGRVYYRVTEEGAGAIKGGDAPADPPRLKIDGEARETYYDALRDARGRLTGGAAVRSMEIGPLPLPVAIEGVRLLAQPTGSGATPDQKGDDGR